VLNGTNPSGMGSPWVQTGRKRRDGAAHIGHVSSAGMKTVEADPCRLPLPLPLGLPLLR
jgi:hypothetical protein